MELEEAVQILELMPGDGLGGLRQKYHERMHQCHPDACPDEKSTARAQKLNEAYSLLKKNWPLPGFTALGGHWSERINPGAYAKRKIRMADSLGDGEFILDVAEGRYLWEPEQEPFPLFLRSVGELAGTLSARAGLDERDRGRILHLLLQQYVSPLQALQDLERMGQTERTKDGWSVRCQVEASAYERLQGEFKVAVRSLRIYGLDDDGQVLGQISFPEDALYYVCTPLLLQGAATGALVLPGTLEGTAKPRAARNRGIRRPSYREGKIKLTFTEKAWEDPTEKITREIDRIMKKAGPEG